MKNLSLCRILVILLVVLSCPCFRCDPFKEHRYNEGPEHYDEDKYHDHDDSLAQQAGRSLGRHKQTGKNLAGGKGENQATSEENGKNKATPDKSGKNPGKPKESGENQANSKESESGKNQAKPKESSINQAKPKESGKNQAKPRKSSKNPEASGKSLAKPKASAKNQTTPEGNGENQAKHEESGKNQANSNESGKNEAKHEEIVKNQTTPEGSNKNHTTSEGNGENQNTHEQASSKNLTTNPEASGKNQSKPEESGKTEAEATSEGTAGFWEDPEGMIRLNENTTSLDLLQLPLRRNLTRYEPGKPRELHPVRIIPGSRCIYRKFADFFNRAAKLNIIPADLLRRAIYTRNGTDNYFYDAEDLCVLIDDELNIDIYRFDCNKNGVCDCGMYYSFVDPNVPQPEPVNNVRTYMAVNGLDRKLVAQGELCLSGYVGHCTLENSTAIDKLNCMRYYDCHLDEAYGPILINSVTKEVYGRCVVKRGDQRLSLELRNGGGQKKVVSIR